MRLGKPLVFVQQDRGKRIQHLRSQLGTIGFGELQGKSLDFGKCHHGQKRNPMSAEIKAVDVPSEA
jgi:hypothetical protein